MYFKLKEALKPNEEFEMNKELSLCKEKLNEIERKLQGYVMRLHRVVINK